MSKRHLKRIAAPRRWPIERKNEKWIIRPFGGMQNNDVSMPLTVVLKELVKVCKTSRESKKIIDEKKVLVDGRIRDEPRFNVGLMSVVSLPLIKKNYRMILNNKGKLSLIQISDSESKNKICKITGKRLIRGKVQLNLDDGRCILVEKDEYKCGDSLLISLPNQNIIDRVKFEKGASVYLEGGSHAGIIGKLVEIQDKNILVKIDDKNEIETLKRYGLAVGKDKPLLKLKEENEEQKK